jgi:tetratricopeptide (TPR) repeat protein
MQNQAESSVFICEGPVMSEDIFSPGREHVPPPPSSVTNEPPAPAVPPGPDIRRSKRGLWVGVLVGLLVVLAGLAGGAWWWLHRPVDWEAVYETNNRGVALMEQFHYPQAIPVFEDVVKRAPDWQPGRINLGIALLNAGGDDAGLLPRARATFEEVLKKEPGNPYGHFCLGILLMYQKDSGEAVRHFEAVLEKDPDDAYSWYWLGTLKPQASKEQSECYRKALKLNRHLIGAIYGEAMNLRAKDPEAAQAFLKEMEDLKRAEWQNVAAVKFSQMGPYAAVIGRTGDPTADPRTGPLPLFQHREKLDVRLTLGAHWATSTDFGEDAVGEVRRLVRARFGATVVVLDYDGDGKPDLFLAGAVVEKGQVRDLLLHNDGEGRFRDVTAAAGLAAPRPTLGCCVADLDNDGRPDLLLTGVGVLKMFRNTGDGKFEDVTSKVKLPDVKAVCLTAVAIDLDQDSDLDLLVCEFAATPEDAVKLLKGAKAAASGALAVYLNQAVAEPVRSPADKAPPLDCKYQRTHSPGQKLATVPPLEGPAGPTVALAASDMDGDRDLDFLVLQDKAVPAVVINDRLLHFRRQALSDKRAAAGDWNGALVFDVDHDGRSDLFLLPTGKRPLLLLNRMKPGQESVAEWFESGATDAPALRQAVAIDVDLDSWTDVVGLSNERLPVLLHNEGGRLVLHRDAFGRADDWPRDLIALAVCDANGDVSPDLFVWSESKGLQLYENRGNGNSALQVRLVGRNSVDGQNRIRCNADGIGTWTWVQAGDLWAGQENTTLSAGLGQSRQPLLLGLGGRAKADVLRLRWPDGTWQAEPDTMDANWKGGPELIAGKVYRVGQRNRMPGSCPILFAWDGHRFGFVTDFLGAGSVGETGPDGTCRPPRPEESVKIEAEQLLPRDGEYLLKITEPMDETTYLDRLELVALDHPPGVRVYPDERFVTAGPPPSQQLIAFGREIHPVCARDHRGRDVTETLRRWDRVSVDDFAKRSWIGFAEEHGIVLDFGDQLAGFKADDRLFLCLTGWTEYPFPESSWAAHQAGVTEQWPVLERQDDSGRWRSLGEAGFPAGLPRMTLLDVTGKLTGPRCRFRLRTNMQVYWDQAFIAADCRTVVPGAAPSGPNAVRATSLQVSRATLEPGRVVKECSPDGRAPALYDYHRHEDVPLVRQSGRLTRFGDVAELLRDRDDCFVVFGPGDDLTVRFDAASLPPLPAGWRRSFVLRTAGYCKDTALSTAHGATVGPLPFRAMRNYPYGPDEEYPHDPLHLDYLRRFLTREVQADSAPARPRR